MADGVSRLIELLTEKETALQELLGLLEAERECLLQLDMAKLQGQAQKKQDVYDRVGRTARLCRQLIDQLAGELGVAGARTLSPLLPAVPAEQRTVLQGLQQRLQEQGKTMDKLSALNEQLLQNALQTVNRSLEFFGRIFNRSTTYGGAGRMITSAPSARLLRREA